MDAPIPDELRAALADIRAAQTRLDADRARVRQQILDAEPTWGPCLQCGHTWRTKNLRRRLGKPPRMCPNCKSKYWYDPEYVPRVPSAGKSAAGAEQPKGDSQDSAPATPQPMPGAMPPPPRFEPEDSALDMMHEAEKDTNK